MENLATKYLKLNKSFKKKFVFHLGADAGFFSEYNNMILAMLYCLENRIQFKLYSDDANFKIDKGWLDFFEPFCDEVRDSFHSKYNCRYPFNTESRSFIDKIKINLYKKFNGIDYLTYELWNEFHNRKMEDRKYCIPELGINGDLKSACEKLISITWKYNEEITKSISSKIEELNITANYIGFHIRQGDKGIESEIVKAAQYIEQAEKYSDLRNAFVLTDDYTVIEDLRTDYPEWNVYTLCAKSEKGYVHSQFQKESQIERKAKLENLFASVGLLIKSDFFIGTYSSNIGMFVGMLLDDEKCKCMDLEHWQIW